MLARYMLSSRIRLSVHLSATSRHCIKTTGRIELGFGVEVTYPTLCYEEIWVGPISNNQGTSFWDFVPNSGLRKFRHGKLIALSTKLVVVVDGRVC